MSTDEPTIDATTPARFIASALQTAQIHTANASGMCGGCLATWARLTPHPCMQAQWARSALAQHRDRSSDQPPRENS